MAPYVELENGREHKAFILRMPVISALVVLLALAAVSLMLVEDMINNKMQGISMYSEMPFTTLS